ncbi:TetR/AcrR family transcriptional regulator [Streptomyces sp. NPDC001537]
MTSPPQRRGRQRRSRIIAAAAELIDAAGAAGRQVVTLRDIAAAADTPTASIYHYFPDVESIFTAVAAQYCAELIAAAEGALAQPTGTPDAALTAITATYREFFAARPGLRELWFDRRSNAAITAIHRGYRARLAETLGVRMAEYTTKADDPLTYVMLIEISSVLWEMSFNLAPEGDDYAIAEIIVLAKRFLHRRAGIPFMVMNGRQACLTVRPAGESRPFFAARDAAGQAAVRPWETPLPPQARGRRRRAEILTAAMSVIDRDRSHGAGVTVKAIADAAGTSPASIYHYFQDLESLVACVAGEYMTELLQLSDAPAETPCGDHSAWYRRTIAAYREFFAARPGLRELWFDRRASEKVRIVHAHYRQLLAQRNQALFARQLDDPGALLTHAMYVEAAGALWDLAFSLDPNGHPAVVEEIAEFARDLFERLQGEQSVA